MAGSLVQVNKTVSGGSDTTLKLIQTQNNNEVINMRVTKSGTAQTDSEYDRAYKVISSTAFSNSNYQNGTGGRIMENVDDAYGGGQGIFYLYNFNSSSTYSWWTNQNVTTVSNQSAGSAGGHIHTVASASDGIEVYGSSGGTFIDGASAVLYKVV